MEHQATEETRDNGLDGLEFGLDNDLIQEYKIALLVVFFPFKLIQYIRQQSINLPSDMLPVNFYVLYQDFNDLVLYA
jgi:hypothetical protein